MVFALCREQSDWYGASKNVSRETYHFCDLKNFLLSDHKKKVFCEDASQNYPEYKLIGSRIATLRIIKALLIDLVLL